MPRGQSPDNNAKGSKFKQLSDSLTGEEITQAINNNSDNKETQRHIRDVLKGTIEGRTQSEIGKSTEPEITGSRVGQLQNRLFGILGHAVRNKDKNTETD
jgi:hypothetical protein